MLQNVRNLSTFSALPQKNYIEKIGKLTVENHFLILENIRKRCYRHSVNWILKF